MAPGPSPSLSASLSGLEQEKTPARRLEDVAVLQESLGAYTRMAHAFRRQLRFRPALRCLRSALSACDSLEEEHSSAPNSPEARGVGVLRAKTRLNVSAVLGDLGEQLDAKRESVYAKDELTRILLAWWEQEPEARRPYLYADPLHVEAVACLCLCYRGLGQLDAELEPSYLPQALLIALWLLPREHALPRVLRQELEKKGYPHPDLGAADGPPEARTLLEPGMRLVFSGLVDIPARGVDQTASASFMRPPATADSGNSGLACQPRVSVSAGDEGGEKRRTKGMGMRPNSSPDFTRTHTGLNEPGIGADDMRNRNNPFSEFRSTNDADDTLRKAMLMDDSRQKHSRLGMRRQKTLLQDELRAKTPQELYDNKVLFNPTTVRGREEGAVPSETQRDVTALKGGLQHSQTKMISKRQDLGLLIAVSGDSKRGGSKQTKRDASKQKKRPGELPELRASERFELNQLGVTAKEVEKLQRIYGRFRGSDGLITKDTMARALTRRKEFSAERFDELWNTIDIKGTNDVNFMTLARWCRRCLPYAVEEGL